MDLQYLHQFYEVARAGSFTAAARKLHVSQSTLSKAVALLEAREGVMLLQRSKKGVVLTAVGEEVFNRSAQIFSTVQEIEEVCRGRKEIYEGSVCFGASDHITNYILIPPLKKLREQYPKIKPSVFAGTPHEMIQLLFEGALEFGLFFTKVNSPGIVYDEVATFPMAVVCHPKLVRKNRSFNVLIEELDFIGSIRRDYQHHPSQGLFHVAGSEVRAGFESNSQETQKRFCLQGGGLAYLAKFMVEKEIRDGELVEISVTKPLSVTLLLARRRGGGLSRVAQLYFDNLRQIALERFQNSREL